MYQLKRVSTSPATPFRIAIAQAQEDGDAGLTAGGSFEFYPAGSDEGPQAHQVSEHAARAIMEDPGIAQHFECTPPLAPKGSPAAPADAGNARAGKSRGRAVTDDVN